MCPESCPCPGCPIHSIFSHSGPVFCPSPLVPALIPRPPCSSLTSSLLSETFPDPLLPTSALWDPATLSLMALIPTTRPNIFLIHWARPLPLAEPEHPEAGHRHLFCLLLLPQHLEEHSVRNQGPLTPTGGFLGARGHTKGFTCMISLSLPLYTKGNRGREDSVSCPKPHRL